MKKYWPVILVLIGVLVLGGVYFFVIRGRGGGLPDEDERVAEIPLEMRPVTSLTPTSDGHYLVLGIYDIKLEAESLDYELLYQTEAGITQGVPGTVKLGGKDDFEAELLLGSESSGKFRYDEGVSEGTLTLRFRNKKGKLTGKLVTDFHLQTGERELTSLDGKFKFTLDKASDEFFVVMETFGLPGEAPGSLVAGPYGVFSSGDGEGEVEMEGDVYWWDGSEWESVSGKTEIGIFVGVSSE